MQASLILSCLAFLACTHQGLSMEEGRDVEQVVGSLKEATTADRPPARRGCGCCHHHGPVTDQKVSRENAPVAAPRSAQAEAADQAALAATTTAPVREAPQAQDHVKVADAVKQEGAVTRAEDVAVKQEGAPAVQHEGAASETNAPISPLPGTKADDAQA